MGYSSGGLRLAPNPPYTSFVNAEYEFMTMRTDKNHQILREVEK